MYIVVRMHRSRTIVNISYNLTPRICSKTSCWNLNIRTSIIAVFLLSYIINTYTIKHM
nr:MAG TPA: hypothetical protein [Crassvirales sp.]